jgi:hypothetical protein
MPREAIRNRRVLKNDVMALFRSFFGDRTWGEITDEEALRELVADLDVGTTACHLEFKLANGRQLTPYTRKPSRFNHNAGLAKSDAVYLNHVRLAFIEKAREYVKMVRETRKVLDPAVVYERPINTTART